MIKHSTPFTHGTLHVTFCTLVLLICTGIQAQLDSARQQALDGIIANLRSDYRLCTGDTSDISDNTLLHWHKNIDSIITGSDYGTIAKKYFQETGLSPANVRPCEIIRWMQDSERSLQEYSTILSEAKDTILQRRDDSLHLQAELAKNSRAAYDLLGIPFGISRRAFRIMMQTRKTGNAMETGTFIRYDSVPFGNYSYRVAFHFSNDGTYQSYEIESNTCDFDSLNTGARPRLNTIATEFEKMVNIPPDHIYRVGQFDIVPGRLAICRQWIFPAATAYFGLGRNGSRFYAKAIVSGTK